MVLRTNIESMYSNRQLGKNNNLVGKSLEKLASGYAINKAADDASGLAITEKMRAQITGLDQGTDNALDGVCLVQTAEGGMNEIHSMLNRMTELATKSANGTIQDEVDREAIQAEVDVLIDEIDRIAQSTNYNGIPLLDGSLAGCGGSSSVTLNIDTSLSTTVGSFTVYGGILGTDFDYDTTTGELSILSSTHMRIEGGSNTESIVVDDSAGSANLALKDVNITSSTGSAFSTGNNDVYIELEGINELNSTNGGSTPSTYGSAGLNVGEVGSLIIDGLGSLTASSSYAGAGIGSDANGTSGDIIINGGNITATANSGAGIGSGYYGTVGNITINGGDITTNGGFNGAGIGSGYYGTAGNITIANGNIEATSDHAGAGIGSGHYGTVGNITITNGVITATSGSWGAGIGSGAYGEGLDIVISNGIINAEGGVYGTGIGSGLGGKVEDITLANQNIFATGGTASNFDTDNVGAGMNGTAGDITYISPVVTSPNTDSDLSSTTTTTTCGQALILHVGDQNADYNKIKVYIDPMTGEALKIKPLYVDTQESAGFAIDKIRNAINYVSENRGNLGALQNRLEHTVNTNNNTSENMSSAKSVIKDTDMASEMMEYTKMNVLVQSAQSMLAQSNQAPQSILELLG